MIKICLNCEREFDSKRPNGKFCCNVCRASFSQDKNKGSSLGVSITIYALVNPINESVFYVGKTVGSLERRLKSHLKDDTNLKKTEIISEIISKNKEPIIIILETIVCLSEEEEISALMREDFWIKEYTKKGDLCNRQGVKSPIKPRLLSNYAKESYKTNPTGIRFELEKVELVKSREKLNTYQKVVDFLLNKYWWEHKIAVPTHKQAPPLTLKEEMIAEQPKRQIDQNTHLNNFKSYNQFLQEKRECETEEQWNQLEAEIDSSDLSIKQKKLLKIV